MPAMGICGPLETTELTDTVLPALNGSRVKTLSRFSIGSSKKFYVMIFWVLLKVNSKVK